MKVVKISKNQEAFFEAYKFKYKLELRENNPAIKRPRLKGDKDNDENNLISLQTYYSCKLGKSKSVKTLDELSIESKKNMTILI